MDQVPELQNLVERLKANPNFCLAPWVHFQVAPTGSVVPCRMWTGDEVAGSLAEKSLEEIWNGPFYKNLRLKMLRGEEVDGCHICIKEDRYGISSVRKWFLGEYPKQITQAAFTPSNGQFHVRSLNYLALRLTNLCNFKCRGCSPHYSSAWYEDFRDLGYALPSKKLIRLKDSSQAWAGIESQIMTAKHIYFLGGEPLVSEEHYQIIQKLLAADSHQVRLGYVSNWSHLSYRGLFFPDAWARFQSVRIGISLDDLGSRAEYFRKGTRWSAFQKNLEALRNLPGNVSAYINCTVNAHNVFNLPEIIDWVLEGNFVAPSRFCTNILFQPDIMHIAHLPIGFKQRAAHKLKQFIKAPKWYLENKTLVVRIQAVIDLLEKENVPDLFSEFVAFTTRLDKLRAENFLSVFPEFSDFWPA